MGRVGCLRPAPPHTPSDSAPERVVSVLSELRSVRAREGDGATFECTVSEVETTGSWKLGGRPLKPGGRVRIRQEGGADFLAPQAPFLPRPRLTEAPPHWEKPRLQLEWAPPHGPRSRLPVFPRSPPLRSQSWPAPLTPRHLNFEHPSAHRDPLQPYPHSRTVPRGGSGLTSAPLALREETNSGAERAAHGGRR